MHLLHPRDPRWQGPQRIYFAIDLAKNTILFFFIILVIVETPLHRKWYNVYRPTSAYNSNQTTIDFFFRIGIVLIPDILATLISWILQLTSHFHPTYALTQSLIVFILYPIVLTFNVIVVLSDESGMANVDTWRALCYGEMGLQAALTLCWVGLVVCSCVAVHRRRMARREVRIRGWVRGEMELKGLYERRGSEDVDGSVKGGRGSV